MDAAVRRFREIAASKEEVHTLRAPSGGSQNEYGRRVNASCILVPRSAFKNLLACANIDDQPVLDQAFTSEFQSSRTEPVAEGVAEVMLWRTSLRSHESGGSGDCFSRG